MLEFESLKGATDCLKLKPPHLVTLPPLRGATEEYRFEYDRVYDMVSTSGDDALFGELVAPLVSRVLQGFNATVSAQSPACSLLLLLVNARPGAGSPTEFGTRQSDH